MKKHLFVLCYLLGLVGTHAWAQFSHTQLYYVSQPKHSKGLTSWAVAEGGNVLKSNVEVNMAANSSDACQQFTFISNDGGATRYMYYPANKKFVGKDGSLTDKPTDPIYFKKGAYDNTFVAYFDESHQINVNDSRQMKIDNWSTPDGGNSCILVPVATFDPTEALIKMGWHFNASTGHLIIAKDFNPENFKYPWDAFGSKVKSVEIKEGVTLIGKCAFYSCQSITSVTCPASVTEIKEGAFMYVQLTSITFPENSKLTSIGDHAFYECWSLTSITLPQNLKQIGKQAFDICGFLTSVTSLATQAPVLDDDAFGYIDSNAVLYYPPGSDYSSWAAYFSRMVEIGSQENTPVTGITLSQSTKTLTAGSSFTLTATVTPNNATDKTVTWTTSNYAVATVNNGVVNAIGVGTATITAKAGNCTATCVVTVEQGNVEHDGITSIDQLSNTQLYYVSQPKHSKGLTSWAVDEGSNVLKSNVEVNMAANSSDACQQFAFISNDGGATRYMYYPANKKFVGKDGSLTDKPIDPIYFKKGAYDNTFVAYFDESHYINVNSHHSLVVNNWNTPDGGNSCILVKAGSFDPTEALKAFSGSDIKDVIKDNTELTIYDLKGRKIQVQHLEELPEGIYIINGKKTVIK